jgi:hypothetical protein
MLLGSAHTRNVWAFTPIAGINNKKPARNLRQEEYIKHSPFIRVMREVFHRGSESQSCGFIPSIKAAGHDRSSPPAHTGQDGNVLLSIRPFVGCGLSDDSGASFELP